MKSLPSTIAVLLLMTVASTTGLGQESPASSYPSQERFTYKDGSLYFGEMKEGLPEGAGTLFYAEGDLYQGEWKNHAPNGKGTFYWVSKQKALTAIWDDGRPVQILSAEGMGAATNGQAVMPQVVVDYPAADTERRPGETSAVAEKQEVRIWAVVVGVSHYSHLPVLKFADDDAYLFFSFLKSPQGGALSKEQVTLLIDQDATKNRILDAMQAALGAAGENDVVLFYFSGHGLPGAFLPTDFNGYDHALLHTEIKDLLRSSKARHKLVIADACNAGGLVDTGTPGTGGPEAYYTTFSKSTGGTALLLSSKNNELSLEDTGLRSGIFSHFLLEGVNGKADLDGNNMITISELYYYINRNVALYTNLMQTPILIGNFDRDMPVARVRNFLPPIPAGF